MSKATTQHHREQENERDALREKNRLAREEAMASIAAHQGNWALWLDTGFVEDFLRRRLGLSNNPAELAIPSDRILDTIKWHRFREMDKRFNVIGVLMIAPLDADGEPTFTNYGDIAGVINTRLL